MGLTVLSLRVRRILHVESLLDGSAAQVGEEAARFGTQQRFKLRCRQLPDDFLKQGLANNGLLPGAEFASELLDQATGHS